MFQQSWLLMIVRSCLQADCQGWSEAGWQLTRKDGGKSGDSDCGYDDCSNNVSHHCDGGDCNGGDGDGGNGDGSNGNSGNGNGNSGDGGIYKLGVAAGYIV